jgi:hypothetical protein
VEEDVDEVMHIGRTAWPQLAGGCVHSLTIGNTVIPHWVLVYPRCAQA